jgi:hypothetical protein
VIYLGFWYREFFRDWVGKVQPRALGEMLLRNYAGQ